MKMQATIKVPGRIEKYLGEPPLMDLLIFTEAGIVDSKNLLRKREAYNFRLLHN